MATLDSQQRQQILSALDDGQKLAAIKLYRDFTGAGLSDAKRFVEELITTLETGRLPGNEDSTELTERIVEELAAGRKIAAVKMYRDANNCGLKAAKVAVDDIQRQLGDAPQSGCVTSAVAFVAFTVWALSRWLT